MRSLLAFIAVAILAATSAFAQTEADEPNRFVIPPDAASPLRRPDVPAEIPNVEPATPVDVTPEIRRDVEALPAPVKRMRELILAAARSGDIKRLGPLLGTGDQATQLSFQTSETTAIDFLLAASGDPEGHEIMAILVEVLEAGYVRVDEGSEGILYLWPYFSAYPIDALTPAMKVELFRLLTGGDYQDMTEFGAYIFYRVGITEDGEWRFFLSGDA